MPGIGGQLGGSGQGVGGGTGLQQFDTGQRRPQRTLVRQHVVAALAPMLKANGRYVARVRSLPALLSSMTGEALEQVIRSLQNQLPSVLVALGDKEYEPADLEADKVRGDLVVEVYALSSHARGFIDGRLEQDAIATSDVTADPGIDTMLEHLEQLLLGQDVGVATSVELRGKREHHIHTDENVTVWAQTYSVYVQRDINPDRDAPGPITSVEVTGFPSGDVTSTPVTDTVTNLEVPAP